MANGNEKIDKEDLKIARERLYVQRELAGLKNKSTSDEKFNLSIANQLVGIAQNQLDIEKEREALTRKSKDVTNDLLKAEKNRDRILQQINKDKNESNLLLKENLDLSKKIIADLKKEELSVKKIESAFGLTGKSLGVINKLLGGAIPGLDKIEIKTRERLAKLEREGKLLEGSAGKMQGFGVQI